MSTYTFLPQGFTNRQDSPSPQFLIPRSQAESIRGQAEMVCRGGMQDGETPPDPVEDNDTLSHL